jgi:mono/diheme cytochrome c family protein
MKQSLFALAPLAAALILTVPVTAQSANPATTPINSAATAAAAGNAENGKRAFVKYGCYTCHAYDGHGGVGPKLGPKPIAPAAFIAIVRHPPPSNMPIFTAKIVSDAELNDMLAYLRSIPEPPAAKDIAILNP